MSALRSFRRGRGRRLLMAGAVLIAVATFGVVFVASSGANLTNSTFEGNDGNMIVDNPGDTDWANVAGLQTLIDNPSGSTDNSFTQGTEEDNSTVTIADGSIPPNKNDLTRAYIASQQVGSNSFLYLAWERAVNIGSANIDFELDQKATPGWTGATTGQLTINRSEGDLLVTYDFSGSGTPTIGLLKWLTNNGTNTNSDCSKSGQTLPCWGDQIQLGATVAEAAVNSGNILETQTGATLTAGLFGEASLNLTSALVAEGFNPNTCEAFGSVFVKSRSSGSSFDSELKDFIAPGPIHVSNCATPTIATQTSLSSMTVGDTASIGDSATLSNANNPTGKLTFTLYSDAACKNSTGVSGDGTISGGQASVSGLSFTPTAVGTYYWGVSYGGDNHNNAVTVCGGANEEIVVNKASPGIATTATMTGSGVVGTDSTSDSATVSGGYKPTGSIQFSITAPDGTTSPVGSPVSVSGDGTYNAPASVPLTEVGTYKWSASYSGDSLNNGAIDDGTNESVTSIPASPSISTQASVTGKGVVGVDLTSDSATVSGGDNPTGSIQFSITAPDGTVTPVGSPVPVNGDNTYNAPASMPLTEVGTYTWSASYSGDSLNNGTVDDGKNESVTSIKASPGIATNASVTGKGVVGTDSTSDSATVSGGDNPTGSIQFSITAPDGSTSTVGSPVPVSGDGTYPAPASVPLSEVGTYTWSASYSGDSLNNGTVDDGTNESVSSIPASPTIATNASVTGKGVVGTDSTSDSATVSGGDNPTGSIQFSIKAPDGTITKIGSPVAVSGDGAYPAPASVPLTEVGTYTWSASYSGDSLNNGAIDDGTNESVTSIPASPSISTQASVTGKGVVGTDLTSDSATVTGGDDPTGSIQFSIKAPDGTVTPVGPPVAVSGDNTYNAPASMPLTEVGTYTWTATYSGDSLNNGAIDDGTNESVTSIPASPSISTQASVTGKGVVGTDSTSDSATVSGGDNPTGSIQFSIKAPDGTTSKVGSPVTVSGDGAYPAPASVPLSELGTYTWSASYSGDSLNNGAVDDGTNESVTSIPASPSISTQASVTGSGVVGTDSTSDSATVSGGDNPTGSIQFSIKAPDGTITKIGSPVTVSGDGAYPAPASVPLTEVGTYTWSASYSGDSLNNGAVDDGANESVTSIPASPGVTTVASPAAATLNAAALQTASDTATFTGGYKLDGNSVTFTLYSDPSCAPADATSVTGPATISGGQATFTGDASSLTAGTYYWGVVFSGDANNNPVSECGGAAGVQNETLAIDSPAIHIVKTADAAQVNAGDPIGFTMTVYNSGSGDALGVKLNDTLPVAPGVAWSIDNTVTPPGAGWAGTCSINAGVLSCGGANGVTVPAGTTQAASTFTVHIVSATTAATGGVCPSGSGVVDNTGTVSASNDASDQSTASTCVAAPAIHIVKTADAAQVNAGDPIGFTMTVSNSGSGDAYGVKLNDTLPSAPGVSWSIDNKVTPPGAGWAGTCSINAGVLSCGGANGVTVPAGTTQAASTFTVHIVSATTAATGGVCPSGSGVVDNTGKVSTTNGGNDQSTASTCVAAPAIHIVKTADAAQVNAGSPIGFTMTVTNSGSGDAYGVKLSDTLPTNAGLSWSIDKTGSGWGSPSSCAIAAGVLTCGPVTVPAGTTQAKSTFTVHVTSATTAATGGVCPSGSGVVNNTGKVSTTNDGSDQSSASTCVAAPGIHIVKTADAAQVNEGSPIGFTMTVYNDGSGDANGVKLSDTLPANPGLSWSVDSTGAGWGANGCSISSGVLSCGGANGVTVPAGTTQAASTFTVHVTSATTAATGGVCPSGSGVVNNTGDVTSSNGGSDQSTASTCVQALVDLAITKVGTPNPITIGNGNITWTMVVTNNGPDTDTGVKIADPLPPYSSFVSVATTQGTCTGGSVINCDLGTMAAGAKATITLVTTPTAVTTLTNTVTVVGDLPETNTANNTASASVVVVGFTPPKTYCTTVTVRPRQLFVGRKTMLKLKLTSHGKAVHGVKVRITGPKIKILTRPSNRHGQIDRTLRPKKAGIVLFKPVRTKSCTSPKIGITGIFTPPVTG